jgi:predicted molibdopterin-dependent oxidoreductase YjgC
VGDVRIPFTIDGMAVGAAPGETVLSVARRHGIEIPALCHHESVSPYGTCRLCVVEVFWGKRSKLVTSCIYTPYEGDRVETNNERVRRTRAMILELLLARCPDVERIRDLARDYGVTRSRFSTDEKVPGLDRCILCGLCVRVCAEAVGRHAIGFASRGSDRLVTTPFALGAEECTGCGACVEVCPTGALTCEDVDGVRIMKEHGVRLPLVSCRVCGEFFATERHVASVREKLAIPDDLARTCPRCRGTEHLNALFKLGEAAGAGAGSPAGWSNESLPERRRVPI